MRLRSDCGRHEIASAELPYLIGMDFVPVLIAAFVVLMLANGFGMYWLARDVFGPQQGWAALAAATAYVWLSYLITNVNIQGRQPRSAHFPVRI